MTATSAYDLVALEFAKVREQLLPAAITSLGRARLLEAEPYAAAEFARAAQRRTLSFVGLHRAGVDPPLGGLSDIRVPLHRALSASRALEPREIVAVQRFLRALEHLRAFLEQRDELAADFAVLAERMDAMPELGQRLEEAVDDRGKVLDQASPHLAGVRREMRELRRLIDARMQALLGRDEVRRALQDDRVRFRDGRPMLSLKRERRGVVSGVVHEFSQSGATAFVEPHETVELGNRLARQLVEERREIARVLLELTKLLLARRETLYSGARAAAEVEMAWISARLVVAEEGCVPRMEEGVFLDLRSARHPLLQKRLRAEGCDEELVPLSLHLGDAFDLLVLTGPNTGGKTVAMKTVGICAALAAAGLPIPALEGSAVPFYAGIYADIGDEQGIAQNLSTFSSHLARISRALAAAGPDTLLLLDELGAGTDPVEGGALGYSILEILLARRVPAIASTHLGALKVFAYRHPRVENASVEFDPASLEPLYRLQIGLPGESNALLIARRLGLDEEILERAEAVLERTDSGLDEVIEEVRKARTEAEASRQRAKELEGRSEQQLEEARTARLSAEERREVVEAEADRVVEESFREVKRRIDDFLPELGTLGKAAQDRIADFFGELEEAMDATPLGARRQAFLGAMRVGSWIYVPKYRKRCVVRKVDRKRREVQALVGEMLMRVPFDEVTWFESL